MGTICVQNTPNLHKTKYHRYLVLVKMGTF